MKKSSSAIQSPYEVLKGVKFGGRFLYAVSTTALSSLAVTCSVLDDRCVAASDLYLQWRLKGIRVSMIAREFTMLHLGILVDGWTGAEITSTEQMCDLPYYAHGSGLFGAPCPSIYISARELDALRQVKFYNTQLSGEDAGFEYQLTIYSYAPFATLNHDVLVEYDMEFASPCDPSQSISMPWYERQKLARAAASKGILWPERKPESKEEGDIVLVTEPGSGSVDAAKCLSNNIAGTAPDRNLSCPGVPRGARSIQLRTLPQVRSRK